MNARGPAAPPRLYALADGDALAPRSLPEAIAEIAAAGVEWIQLRAKTRSSAELLNLVEQTAERLRGSAPKLWLDDRADLAALANAESLIIHGVHVGQRDLPPAAVRRGVGREVWIGQSTHNLTQLDAANADPEVQVIAFGPIFPTASKANPDPVLGLDLLRAARERTQKPLVAIGGIDEQNLASVLAAGADSVAILGAICRPPAGETLEFACRRLLAAAESAR
jgi:thiamine-phosphate pyrophosphorylase